MRDSIRQNKELNGCPAGLHSSGLDQSCSLCAPKLAFTAEEEAILGHMRAIKQQARHITERLKALDRASDGVTSESPLAKDDTEWVELNKELNRLRRDWKEWDDRLDTAIETKLIRLGHRQPK